MKPKFGEILKAGALAGVVSAVVNAVIFFITHAMGFIPDSVLVQGQPMSVVPVVISSFLPSLIAAAVYFLFAKYSQNGYRNFSVVALVLLVLSFAQAPMMIPNVPLSMTVSLNIMHVVVVASLLFFLKRVQPRAEVNYRIV